MSSRALRIVILGLSITSSWGNGHATTYRGLVRGLVRRGHDVLFLERDVPWYAPHRDLEHPPFGTTVLYRNLEELRDTLSHEVRAADLVVVGSYVPDGVAVADWVQREARGATAFYDIDTPVTLAKLARGDEAYLARRQIRRYDVYLSFTGGPTLRRLECEYGSPMARVLYCSFDPELYYPETHSIHWDLGYMGTYSADRQPALEALLLEPARQWRAGRLLCFLRETSEEERCRIGRLARACSRSTRPIIAPSSSKRTRMSRSPARPEDRMGKSTHAARVSQRHGGAAAGDRVPAAKANTGAAQTRSRKPNSRLARELRALGPWFHNLHLPDGTQTAPDHFLGGDFPTFKWREIARHIPQRLDGWRVLDVGCNAGFYSFELAKRGASVVGIDVDPRYLAQARWALDRFALADRIDFRQMEVYEIARLPEKFDLVWFMGVFYHLRYPLLALDLLAQRTRRLLVFQTLTMPGDSVYEVQRDYAIDNRTPLLETGWPKMAFVEEKFSGDPTNWWIANHACVEAMLRSSGLRIVARPGHEIYVCEPARGSGRNRALYASQLRSVTGLTGASM